MAVERARTSTKKKPRFFIEGLLKILAGFFVGDAIPAGRAVSFSTKN